MPVFVNGQEVEPVLIQREMQSLFERYARHMTEEEFEEKQEKLVEDARENAIERVLLMQEAYKTFPSVPIAKVDKRLRAMKEEVGGTKAFYEKYGLTAEDEPEIKKDLEKQLAYDLFIQQLCKEVPKPSEEECRAFYDEKKEGFQIEDAVRVRQILLRPTPQHDAMAVFSDLMNVRQSILDGADFGAIADRISQSQEPGGDLGVIYRGQTIPAFEEVIFSLESGEVSEVFTSENGYHLVQVMGKAEAREVAFEEVYKTILNSLHDERKNEQIGKHVDKLREVADIRIEDEPEAKPEEPNDEEQSD